MEMMKKILISFTVLAALLTFSGAALAVEKKEKKAEDKKVQEANTKEVQKAPVSADVKKKYDDFVDANKNGIDDRCENSKCKKDGSLSKKTALKKDDKKQLVPAVKTEPKKVESKVKDPK